MKDSNQGIGFKLNQKLLFRLFFQNKYRDKTYFFVDSAIVSEEILSVKKAKS